MSNALIAHAEQDYDREIEGLAGPAPATQPSERPQRLDHHDDVDWWFLQNIGELPTPSMKRDLRQKINAQLRSERSEDREFGDLLLATDFDPDQEAAAARRHGIDISEDPDLVKMRNAVISARKRAEKARSPKPKRPSGDLVSSSHRAEAVLRRDASRKVGQAARNSKTSRAKLARDPKRDEGILEEIQSFLGAGIAIQFTSKKVEAVRPEIIASAQTAEHASGHDSRDAVIWLPHWEKAQTNLRAMAMSVAMVEREALAFTLNLSPDVVAYGQNHGEMKFATRIKRRLDDQLQRAFKDQGVSTPGFMFFVEQGRGQAPHLHGIIEMPDCPKAAKIIKGALEAAGGPGWRPSGHDNTQADVSRLYEPAGWVGYSTKFFRLTKEELGENTFAASQAVRALGKRWYQDSRKRRGVLLPGTAKPIRSPSR